MVRQKKSQPPKTEGSLHYRIAGLLTKHLAEPAWFTTFPAGGGGEMRGRILKGRGLKSGVPDILIIWNGLAHWLELKKPGEVARDDQLDCHMTLKLAGCKVGTVDNLEDAKRLFAEWNLPHQVQSRRAGFINVELKKAFANADLIR